MDILQIKNLISKWQKQIEKNDNYLIIETINEIIDVYKKLNQKEKNNLLENLKPLWKKLFSFIYSNDPIVRRNVVNFAYLIENNELINDVIKYLKVEKDYDNLQIYLKYIKKFGVVGFITNILEFAKEVSVLKIKYQAFSIILLLASSYKDYEKVVDFIFNDFKYFMNNTKNFFLLNGVYKELIEVSIIYSREPERIKIPSFFYGFYGYVLTKTVGLIDLLKERINDEEKAHELISNMFIFLLIAYHILEGKDDSFGNLSLANIFMDILSHIKKIDLFLLNIINTIDTLNLKDQFKRFVFDQELIDYFLSLLEKIEEKYALKVLYLLNYLDVELGEAQLLKLEEYTKRVFNEGIIDICVEIFDKNKYYLPVFYFLKYSKAYSDKLKDKLRSVIRKIAKQFNEE